MTSADAAPPVIIFVQAALLMQSAQQSCQGQNMLQLSPDVCETMIVTTSSVSSNKHVCSALGMLAILTSNFIWYVMSWLPHTQHSCTKYSKQSLCTICRNYDMLSLNYL